MTASANTLKAHTVSLNQSHWSRRTWHDWVFALLVVAGAAFVWQQYQGNLDGYEKGILIGTVPMLIGLGWLWRPLQALMLVVAAASLAGIGLYAGDLKRADSVFWLKFLLSSQSAILWMCTLVFMSTLFYWIGLLTSRRTAADGSVADNTALRMGTWLAWGAVGMALIGTMVRWYESHHIGAGIGHIPVSNLYEVFVLFAWMTTLFYLYYEQQYKTRALGAFVMVVVSAAVSFLVWYAVTRDAQAIQPLVPALQSWWMKLHVPANFVGYGTFALAAMVALAYLLKSSEMRPLVIGLLGIPGALLLVIVGFWLLGSPAPEIAAALAKTARLLGGLVAFFGMTVALRNTINRHTPSLEVMDDVMYKAIAVGFAFFTIATVLGALWAAEAWGGYWSWDPKETWALIVWLNYAAWLHMRLMKGLRGSMAAWWALVGLVVVTFAFIGVNMFLTGLHSYGTL